MSLGSAVDPVGMSSSLALGKRPEPPPKNKKCATCNGDEVQEAKLGRFRRGLAGLMFLLSGSVNPDGGEDGFDPIEPNLPNFGQTTFDAVRQR